jgi:hypothetical protein
MCRLEQSTYAVFLLSLYVTAVQAGSGGIGKVPLFFKKERGEKTVIMVHTLKGKMEFEPGKQPVMDCVIFSPVKPQG